MAPVEPARAAAVAVVAAVGVIVAAIAVVKLKSRSKKKATAGSSGESSKDSKSTRETGTLVKEPRGKEVSGETIPKRINIDTSESANIPSLSKKPKSVETVKSEAREKTPKEKTKKPSAEDSGLLLKQVYKADDEPLEQTIVSFAEIKFSPSKSDGNNASGADPGTAPVSDTSEHRETPLHLSVSGGLITEAEAEPESFENIQPEQSTSFEAISVSSICREEGDSNNGQKPGKQDTSLKNKKNGQNSDGSASENSKSDTSFETVELGQDGNADWAEAGKSGSKLTATGDISSVQLPLDLIAQAGGVGPALGAGESLALSVGGEGDEASIGSIPVESGGDASFVLLDVATAPSNCKPDVDIVNSTPLNQLELQQSVSLERLKSAGSDQNDEDTPVQGTTTEDVQPSVGSDPYPNLSETDISDALNVASVRPELLELKHAQTLVSMLSTKDLELQEKILSVIAKVAAFTQNQNLLRESGCIPRLTRLLKSHCMAVQGGVLPLPALLTSLLNAVTNLAVNTANNAVMQDCVPSLVDMTLSHTDTDSVQMSTLQALTNLSVTSDHHGLYTRVIQQLYGLVDSNIPNVQLQALKVMVNLSCNKEMVPHLLAAKAPSCLLSLLEMDTGESTVLRWTTLLANIMHTVKESQMSSSKLPPDDKAASPETMYIALYGLNTSGQLRNKVFVLSKHPNEDIRYQAARIYSGLMK